MALYRDEEAAVAAGDAFEAQNTGRIIPRGFSRWALGGGAALVSAEIAHLLARHNENTGHTNPPPGCGRRCGPADPEVPLVQYGAYAGLAHGIRGPIQPHTFLGISRRKARHPLAYTVRFHDNIRDAAVDASDRVTRSMSGAAKRAGELMESPRVRRTAHGIYTHLRDNVSVRRHSRHRYELRHAWFDGYNMFVNF